MPTDKQLDAAVTAYLAARGWDKMTMESHPATVAEIRDRMKAALTAAENVQDKS